MGITQNIDWDAPVDLGPENKLAIGVLSYGGVHDLVRCVVHICSGTQVPFELIVFDNTERQRTNVRFLQELGDERVSVIDSPSNVGCSVSRNTVYATFLEKYPKLQYFAFLDQDVMVANGWASDMIRVMQAYPQAGVVAWPQANIGKVSMRPDGCVSMVASCCHMQRVLALEDIKARWGGPWDERFFFYRFDSLFGQRVNQAGWRTYLCLKYYQEGKPWLKQTGGMSHPTPNSGIKRNPKWAEIRAESDRLYKTIKAEEGWTEYDPTQEVGYEQS